MSLLGLNATPAALQAARHALGSDLPPLTRYGAWLTGLARGDLGTSLTYHVPIAPLITERLGVSVPLALLALAVALAGGLLLGIAGAASTRGGALARAAARLGLATPVAYLGLLLVLAVAVGLRWLPAGGFPGWSDPAAALAALTLPALALGLPQAAVLARVLSASLTEVLSADYIRTARAKGLSAAALLWRHALRNAALPALATAGLQFGYLLAGSVIVETVFALPGLGRLVLDAVAQRDLPVVQAVAIVLVVFVAVSARLADLAAAAADPRLRR